MDPFSITAGTVGIFSLAIQLYNVTHNVLAVWNQIQQGPDEFRRLRERLQYINVLFKSIAMAASEVPYDDDELILQAIQRCQSLVTHLGSILNGIDKSEEEKSKRARIKDALWLTLGGHDRIKDMDNILQMMLNEVTPAIQLLQIRQGKGYATEIKVHLEAMREISSYEASALSQIGEGVTNLLQQQQALSMMHERDMARLRQWMRSIEGSGASNISSGDRNQPQEISSARYENNGAYEDLSFMDKRQITYRTYGNQRFQLLFGTLTVYMNSSTSKMSVSSNASAYKRPRTSNRLGITFTPSVHFLSGFTAAWYGNMRMSQLDLRTTLTMRQTLSHKHSVFFAAKRKDVEHVRRELIAKKIDINVSDENGRTLLNHAAVNRRLETVQFLIEHGADAKLSDSKASSVLLWMIERANQSRPSDLESRLVYDRREQDLFHLLLQKGDLDPCEVNVDGYSALHYLSFPDSLRERDPAIWRLIVNETMPDLNHKNRFGETPLYLFAAQPSCDVENFKWLLKQGSDVKVSIPETAHQNLQTGLTCLHQAVGSLQGRMFASGAEAFYTSASSDANSLAHINIQARGWSDLQHSRCGSYLGSNHRLNQHQKIRLLIEHGADPHAVSRYWGTVTDVARLSGNFSFWCSILEEFQVDVDDFLREDQEQPRESQWMMMREFLKSQGESGEAVSRKASAFSLAIQACAPPSIRTVFEPFVFEPSRDVCLRVGRFGLVQFFALHVLSGGCMLGNPVFDVHDLVMVSWYVWTALGSTPGTKERVRRFNTAAIIIRQKPLEFLAWLDICSSKARRVSRSEQDTIWRAETGEYNRHEEDYRLFLSTMFEIIGYFHWPDKLTRLVRSENPVPGGWVD